MNKIVSILALAVSTVFLFSSCGTIMGKMSKVALVNAPSNLVVKADGEKVEVKNDLTVSTLSIGMSGDTYADYYSPVIKLNKHKTVTLELSTDGKKGSVDLKPKFSGSYFFGNMFLTGLILGTGIDMATGNHRQHIRYVDVPAVLAGKPRSEWRSKKQLKRAIKKGSR